MQAMPDKHSFSAGTPTLGKQSVAAGKRIEQLSGRKHSIKLTNGTKPQSTRVSNGPTVRIHYLLVF